MPTIYDVMNVNNLYKLVAKVTVAVVPVVTKHFYHCDHSVTLETVIENTKIQEITSITNTCQEFRIILIVISIIQI